MLIIIVIYIIAGLSALAFALYSLFLPSLLSIAAIKNYYTAYYGAVGSLERGALIERYHGPGFEGTGGWIKGISYGRQSDHKIDEFGAISRGSNGMVWSISSISNGQTQSGKQSRILYNNVFSLPLTRDVSPASLYYEPTVDANLQKLSPERLALRLSLPANIVAEYGGGVCDDYGCDEDGDRIGDDVIGLWAMRLTRDGQEYRIVPTVGVNYTSPPAVNQNDSSIRKSILRDENGLLDFFDSFNPVNPFSNLASFVIYPQNSNLQVPFSQIFTDAQNSNISLDLFLTRHLKTIDGYVFPYVEVALDSCSRGLCTPVVLPETTIKGVGVVGSRKVELEETIPSQKRSLSEDFVLYF